MAIGDSARAAGYQVVPDTGENGRVRWGAREINRTRDYIAQVKNSIPSLPSTWAISRGGTGATSRAAARNNLWIRSGTSAPSGGANGDIYFRIV